MLSHYYGGELAVKIVVAGYSRLKINQSLHKTVNNLAR